MPTYNLRDMDVVLAGTPITDFGEFDAVSVTWNQESYQRIVGVDGEVCRMRSDDRGGRIVLTLMQTSRSLTMMETGRILDSLLGTGYFAMTIYSLPMALELPSRVAKEGEVLTSSNTRWEPAFTLYADRCWIAGHPGWDFRRKVGEMKWSIDCKQLRLTEQQGRMATELFET